MILRLKDLERRLTTYDHIRKVIMATLHRAFTPRVETSCGDTLDLFLPHIGLSFHINARAAIGKPGDQRLS